MDPNDDEELGFYRRYRYFIWVGGLILLVAPITLIIRTCTANQPPAKVQSVTFVKLLPPVPTPTPTPPPAQSTPRPQEMVEQKHMDVPETKPVHPDEKPKENNNKKPAAPGPPGNTAKGDSNGSANFTIPGGGGSGGGGGGGTRFGWYASEVQSRIEQALHENSHTRNAAIPGLKVRIWADNAGRISRAQLIGTTGDSAVDNAINNEVLTGLHLQEPPPSDMPMPIVLRVTAHRPN